MEKVIKSNCENYIKYIVTPITSYLICNHCFSTEIYSTNKKYIGIDISRLLTKRPNDLYKNKNFDEIIEGDIIQIQVDLFELFVTTILPKISKKIIILTSQWRLPQLYKNILTDKLLNNDKIILWISQNPIYEKHNKYMAFPYGLKHINLYGKNHGSVNDYMKFVKSNYNFSLNINKKEILCYNLHI